MDFLVIAAADKGGNETDGSVIENFPDVKSLVCRDIPDLFAGDLNHDSIMIVGIAVFLDELNRLVDIGESIYTVTRVTLISESFSSFSPVGVAGCQF